MGAVYVRVKRVPLFLPQKSLKRVQIRKLVSERVPKSRKSKIPLSKGPDFQKFRPNFGEIQPKFGKKSPKIWGKSTRN